MGIKERERRVEVFFYGLFMDEELLRGKGLEPEGGEIAAIDGFALRIGQRAALVPVVGLLSAISAGLLRIILGHKLALWLKPIQ